MISNDNSFQTKPLQLKDNQANRQKFLLFISLFTLFLSACRSPSEEASAPAETQAVDPTTPLEPNAATIGDQIMFSSDQDGDAEIYIMNADGSDQRQLTDNTTDEIELTWSPNTQQVVFISWAEGEYIEVHLMNADGSDIRSLTDETDKPFNPGLSPDGQYITFSSIRDGDYDIYVMNADGSDIRPLTDNRTLDDYSAWSPDGRLIAYSSGFPTTITLMNPEGGEQRPLIEGKEGYGYQPAWSPDSKQLAFVSSRDGDDEIFIVNVDGSNLLKTTDNSDKDGAPAWSPDGKQLAFISDRDGDLDIYIMNVDGSDVRQLTENDSTDSGPVWSSIP